jgi:hypothetical protein
VLIGATVPDFVTLFDAQHMTTGGNQMGAPNKFDEIHIPTPTIQAYHLMPPHTDPLDYDENEPNRIMEPLLAFVAGFHFKIEARISTATTLKNFLDVSKSTFLSFYNANITHPHSPQMKPIQSSMVLVRREGTVFAV